MSPRVVFVRIGYEFDQPANQYVPADFAPAFRRIAERLRLQSQNVRTVWHSWSFEPWEAASNVTVSTWNSDLNLETEWL